MPDNLNRLLDRLDPLQASDADDYELILDTEDITRDPNVSANEVVEKILPNSAIIEDNQLPFSQMRVDTDGTVWLRTWLYRKVYQ